MARKFLTSIDMALNQLKNVLLDTIAGDIPSPVAGQYWYNSVANKLKFRGTTVVHTVLTDTDTLVGDITGTFGANAIGAGVIVNADVNAAAAIAYSKLALANAIVTADLVNGAVTNVKMADMATQTFKGRTTAGTGDPEDLTVAQVKTMLNLAGTNSGDQTITLTGDVTGSGTGSFVATIAAGVIVNADINAAAAIAYSKLALANSIVNADIAAGAAIALSKLAVDPLARANHTGTQVASTISNFDTQVRTSRLDQMAAPTAPVALNAQRITGLANPTGAQDAATKIYVDDAVAGLTWKSSVRAATTANLAALSGLLTVDTVVLVAGDRVLVKDQTASAQNGIYVASSGAWSRAPDMDGTNSSGVNEAANAAVFVEEGGVNDGTAWVMNTIDPVVGTSSLIWVQFAGGNLWTTGQGLNSAGNQIYFQYNLAGGLKINGSNEVEVNYLYVPQKYSINNTAGTSMVVTHLFGHKDVIVQVYDIATGETVECDVVRNSTTAVTVSFAVSQAVNTLRIVVVG